MSHLEDRFAKLWEENFPHIDLHSQYRFAYPRRWTWDFADPHRRIGIEIQGGIWQPKSGHSGGSGMKNGAEKSCFASMLGWRMFQLIDKTINIHQLSVIAETILCTPTQLIGLEDWQLKHLINIDPTDLGQLKAGAKPKQLTAFERRVRAHYQYQSGLWVPKINS